MNFEDAIAKATRELDGHLARLFDEQFARMVASGMDVETAEELRATQHQETKAWRDETILKVRALARTAFDGEGTP